jgi:hypothetical protein
MRLMQAANVELEPSTMRTLLRFLVRSEPLSDITWKIIKRIYREKDYPMCHIEAEALTIIILKRTSIISIAPYKSGIPLYKDDNYLEVVPKALPQVRSC